MASAMSASLSGVLGAVPPVGSRGLRGQSQPEVEDLCVIL
jgi:hypothetical protein